MPRLLRAPAAMLSCVILALAACEPAPLEVKNDAALAPWFVVALAEAHASRVSIRISKTSEPMEGVSPGPAVMRGSVAVNGFVYDVERDAACPQICFRATVDSLPEGSVVTMHLVIDGSVVEGATTVPGRPNASIDATQAVLDRRYVTGEYATGLDAATWNLFWQTSTSSDASITGTLTRGYAGDAPIEGKFCNVAASPQASDELSTPGSGSWRIYHVSCPAPSPSHLDSADVQIDVTTYDANYAAYRRAILNQEEFREDRGSFGITGALGVFGSASTMILISKLSIR